ncbi:hypothetical protein Micbo1qcDRAFT_206461 [Microdochium bolleyi]|uniref:Uncharacterized protein n=1 Tax=Microdochium bolleyi TaxID=196109 RepID=A0A136IXM3_9PEZI|nr:hypothetical protein Micbo1qcDRAFT_206461 [Microdochium bolleyi]
MHLSDFNLLVLGAAVAAAGSVSDAVNPDHLSEMMARRQALFEDLERRGSVTEALNSTWQNSANCPTGHKACGKGCIRVENKCCNDALGTYCLNYETCFRYNGPTIPLGWACWYTTKNEPVPTNADGVGGATTTFNLGGGSPTGTGGTTAGTGGGSGGGTGAAARQAGAEGGQVLAGVAMGLGLAALVPLVL